MPLNLIRYTAKESLMTTLKIPDLGGATDVEVIEVLVSEGDGIEKEQALIVLETDKASMEIPADTDGTVAAVLIKVGDKVNEGDEFVELSGGSVAKDSNTAPDVATELAAEPVKEQHDEETAAPGLEVASAPVGSSELVTINIPDIGGASDVDVIEVSVRVGDTITEEDSIITLETDKTSMEIPAGVNGTIEEILVTLGGKVNEGDPMLVVKSSSTAKPVEAPASTSASKSTPTPAAAVTETSPTKPPVSSVSDRVDEQPEIPASKVHAGPAVRKLAREFGVDLSRIKGSGPKGRVVKEDVQAFVKERVKGPISSGGTGIPAVPKVDFASFGPITVEPLNNIKRATAKAMTTALLNVPQVTQFDQVDITSLEAFRKDFNAQGGSVKVSIVPFVLKALAKAMEEFPTFNSSLSEDGESLVMKQYIHIGVAVDTPKGLLVPVIRDVNKKTVTEITQELGDKAMLAREGKLSLKDMQGGCLSLSSLGGIGGTAFTPIVNPPEVAILGLSKAEMKPLWDGNSFQPKLMLPTSLSYDHRVIDGAEAARFSQRLVTILGDIRNLLM
jgi:pyruvate dehydrogenase E2 component (dihydrolipoamide acetyltransferase)